MVVANWNNLGTHMPISLAVAEKLDPDGWLWSSVLAITWQPRHLV
jgi:6-phosphofructokinase 1